MMSYIMSEIHTSSTWKVNVQNATYWARFSPGDKVSHCRFCETSIDFNERFSEPVAGEQSSFMQFRFLNWSYTMDKFGPFFVWHTKNIEYVSITLSNEFSLAFDFCNIEAVDLDIIQIPNSLYLSIKKFVTYDVIRY